VMRAGTRRPWVRRRLAEVFHMLRPPSALFGPGVLARLAYDRLAGVTGADRRRVGDPRCGTDGGSRPVPADSRLHLGLNHEEWHRGTRELSHHVKPSTTNYGSLRRADGRIGTSVFHSDHR
jgi:hypothetical protein